MIWPEILLPDIETNRVNALFEQGACDLIIYVISVCYGSNTFNERLRADHFIKQSIHEHQIINWFYYWILFL